MRDLGDDVTYSLTQTQPFIVKDMFSHICHRQQSIKLGKSRKVEQKDNSWPYDSFIHLIVYLFNYLIRYGLFHALPLGGRVFFGIPRPGGKSFLFPAQEGGKVMVYHALPRKYFRRGVKCLLYHALPEKTLQEGREIFVISRPPLFSNYFKFPNPLYIFSTIMNRLPPLGGLDQLGIILISNFLNINYSSACVIK